MNILKKLFGKILYGFAKVIEFVLDVFISIIEFIVAIVINVGRGILGLIGMGGCLLFIMLAPFGIALLFNPITLLILLLFVIIPMLGTKSISYLKYIKYTITEFLYDRANYLIEGKQNQFKSFNEYGNKYKKMEEERIRREQQQRQAEQQRRWEEKFRQWNEYQNSQRNNSGYGYGGYGNGQTYTNPTVEFKSKYEKSCDLLGIEYNTDIYEIKLAYRKKAKEYHPDLNKSPDATAKFQEINEAYEFLSEVNIERYKQMFA